MTAQTLRDAAKVLRERAENARDVTGASDWWSEGRGLHFTGEYGVRSSGGAVAGDMAEEHADYIATVHPGVGLALADWLEDEAFRADYREDQQRFANATRLRAEPFPCYYDRGTNMAIAVARAVLGGDA